MDPLSSEGGVQQRPHFDWREFAEHVKNANEVFILQNGIPNCENVFSVVADRINKTKGQCRFRATIYDPDSDAAKKRAFQLDDMQQEKARFGKEMKKLISDTIESFQIMKEKVSPCKAEIRYVKGVLPYVVYATDSAVWVGWLWRDCVTNNGPQLYAIKGSQFFLLIWDYLYSEWETGTSEIPSHKQIT